MNTKINKMQNTNADTHTDNPTLELFRLERAFFLALADKILDSLINPNNFTQPEKEFWTERARHFHQFATDANERIKSVVAILDSQVNAVNAYLN